MNSASSLQVDINNTCNLNCKYCVAKMNPTKSKYSFDNQLSDDELSSALMKARQHASVMVLTGTGEPLLNLEYLFKILELNSKITNPFPEVELQTNGHLLSHYLLEKLKRHGVTLVAVSICAFDKDVQKEYMGKSIDIISIIRMIKHVGLLSRITSILTDQNECSPVLFLGTGIDQLTFKRMWRDCNSDVSAWIDKHDVSEHSLNYLYKSNHAQRWRIDENCMAKNWYVLRPWGLFDNWHE